MIRIQQLKIEIPKHLSKDEFVQYEQEVLQKKILKLLSVSEKKVLEWKIVKRSLDARKKPVIFYQYIIDVSLDGSIQEEKTLIKKTKDKNIVFYEEKKYHFPYHILHETDLRPVVVGMGPAGLFCAYYLAKYGFRPILLERGKKVEERRKDVELFWDTGRLNTESNVQFGEGGAGTFSDGKLNTLVKEKYGRNKETLKVLAEHGASEKILYENKPHIGTDVLIHVVKSMREQIIRWGAEIYFETKMTDFLIENGEIQGVFTSTDKFFKTNLVVLALGHSARDTFELCMEKRVPMRPKPFAVGFRVEHPQNLINTEQYGEQCPLSLAAAEYKVTAKTDGGRGVYSFCMCPGGYVVNASSEQGRLAVNGMSYSGRSGENANSAIIMTITPEDFGGEGPLSGMEFQRRLEEKAFLLGEGKIPVQYYKDFKKRSEHKDHIEEGFLPQMKGDYKFSEVNRILSEDLNHSFIQGMEHFHRIIPGFADDYAIVAGIESRTSSPIRMERDENGESEIKGIFPCGEGAGYAGGITSAAMDGIYIAEQVAKNIMEREEKKHG